MKRIRCQYNIDTACVEIRYDNRVTSSVENQLSRNLNERSSLDCLICNAPTDCRKQRSSILRRLLSKAILSLVG